MSESFELELSSLPGTLTTNISQLKAFLDTAVEPYMNQVITDDQVVFAKKDLAKLRKLKDALESERKRAKAIILKPYEEFEVIYKDAVKSLDSAIQGIDSQVKGYQEQFREERAQAVSKAIAETAEDLEEGLSGLITERVRAWLCDPSWLLSSTRWKKAEEEIRDAVQGFYDNLLVIRSMDDDYTALRVDVYLSTGSVRTAQDRVNEIKRQGEVRKAREQADREKQEEAKVELKEESAEKTKESLSSSFASVTDLSDPEGPKEIRVYIPPVPNDPAKRRMTETLAVLEMPRYLKRSFRDAMTAMGVRVIKAGGSKE